MKPRLTLLALAVFQPDAWSEDFIVDGSIFGDRKVVVQYDPKTPHLYDFGAEIILMQGTDKIAKLTGLGIDWSWNGNRVDKAIYGVEWNEYGDLFRIHYQAGRLLTGFAVYRLNGDKTVSQIPVGATLATLYLDGKIGKMPQNSNNSGVHALKWLSRATLLCTINTEDKGVSYVTVKIGRDTIPKITNIFQLNDEEE